MSSSVPVWCVMAVKFGRGSVSSVRVGRLSLVASSRDALGLGGCVEFR